MNRQLNILYLEDNIVDSMHFNMRLQEVYPNCVLESIQSSEEALKSLIEKDYDCAFIRDYLPDRNGIDVIKMARKEGVDVPLVLISTISNEQLAVEAMKEGASDYIPKDLLSPYSLKKCIEVCVEKYELQKKNKFLETGYRTILSNSPIVTFVIDSNGVFTLIEGKGTQEVGLVPSKIVGKTIYEVYKSQPRVLKLLEKGLKGQIVSDNIRMDDFVFDTYCYPMVSGKRVTGLFGLATNVTEYTRAKEIAEKSAQLKEEFLASMSHEIRTPMNAIIGYSEMLSESDLSENQREDVNTIRQAGENLLALINDILDFSKIEAGKLIIEHLAFDLHSTLHEILKVLSIGVLEKDVELELILDEKVPSNVIGDAHRLNQILTNLISNAVKFTEKGKITVIVKPHSVQSNKQIISFSVIDTGIGIEQDRIEAIFESFSQANDSTSRKYGGTGLGLSIVKRLVELQEGSINAKSTFGKGSEFTFKLPFEIAVEKGIAVDAVVSSSHEDVAILSGLKVLLAEDNLMNRVLAEKILGKWGVDLDTAEDGQIALDKLYEKRYDLILMDLQMPHRTGYEVVEHIRRDELCPNHQGKIIAMTAHAFETERKKCFEIGMNDYISKPYKKEGLKRKILQLLSSNP